MSTTDIFAFKLADGSVLSSLKDGEFGPPADILIDPASDDATARLRADFPDGLNITVNAFLLQRDGRNILIDSGAADAFGPTLGRVAGHLESLGVTPDVVLVTHPHGDHVLGLLNDAKDALRYPGLDVYLPGVDVDHFSASGNPNHEISRKFFGLLGDKLKRFGVGEVVPGVEAVSLPGHTPGHSGFLIGGEVLIWADLIHLIRHQAQNPEIALIFDEDRALAATTRRDTLALAADKGWVVGGSHLPSPALGRVSEEGQGFRIDLL